jgi:hypothetical protein
MEKAEGRARILPCSSLYVRNKVTLIILSHMELQASSALFYLKNIETSWDEAPCESCSLLADRCVPRGSDWATESGSRCWVLTYVPPSSLPAKSSCIITLTISLSPGHSPLSLKKEALYGSETSASTSNAAQCCGSKERSLFIIESF